MKYIVCNLKENKNLEEINEYKKDVLDINESDDINLIICPSFPFLSMFTDSKITLGSQDVSKYKDGAYTGEVSATQLSSLNVSYVLIGHSERQLYFNECDQDFIIKAKNCLENDMKIIYFIGEKNKDSINLVNHELKNKINFIFNNIDEKYYKNIILAYEPNWSIGTTNIPNISDLKNIIICIKDNVKEHTELNVPLLYGGGVHENNMKELFSLDEIDGFVLGESSLDAKTLKNFYNSYKQKNL